VDVEGEFRAPERHRGTGPDVTGGRCIDGSRAQVFSTTGELLRDYSGFFEIEIPEDDWPAIAGQVLVHYHENDIAFSKGDFITASLFNLAEIRIISRELEFSLKPRKKSWPAPRTLARKYDKYWNNPSLLETIERVMTSPEFLESSWDPERDILKIRTRYICNQLAKECGLAFHITPVEGSCTRQSPDPRVRHAPLQSPL